MTTSDQCTLIKNISRLVSMRPLAENQRISGVSSSDLGAIDNAYMLIKSNKILEIGEENKAGPLLLERGAKKNLTIVDVGGKCVLPGLIDSHTHPVFAGSRHEEFAMRLDGKTYQEIAEAGGGIKSTVKSTREAKDSELSEQTLKRFQTFLSKGVTTLEAKSGYGLSSKEEIRELQILRKTADASLINVVSTCLAMHALPPEFTNNVAYAEVVSKELLPLVAEQKLASYVDAFIETGYFSVKDCEPYFQAAADLGLKIRVHADEFTDAGAAAAAADWGAASADHLQFASDEGINKMAKSKTIATILPGTSLYTAIPFTQAGKFFEQGCGVAIATDYNPGSCLVDNLPMMATVAALHCGFTTAQAIAAVTYIPAVSLGFEKSKGALVPGFDADFIVTQAESETEWLADMGRTLPEQVWVGGVLW